MSGYDSSVLQITEVRPAFLGRERTSGRGGRLPLWHNFVSTHFICMPHRNDVTSRDCMIFNHMALHNYKQKPKVQQSTMQESEEVNAVPWFPLETLELCRKAYVERPRELHQQNFKTRNLGSAPGVEMKACLEWSRLVALSKTLLSSRVYNFDKVLSIFQLPIKKNL